VHHFRICKENAAARERDNVVYWKTNGKINDDLQCSSADFQFLNVFGRKIRRKSALCSHILFANPEVMFRLIDVAFITS